MGRVEGIQSQQRRDNRIALYRGAKLLIRPAYPAINVFSVRMFHSWPRVLSTNESTLYVSSATVNLYERNNRRK